MRKRLLWICIGCVALVGVSLVLFSPRSQESFDHWMTLGGGYLQKGEATNAANAYSKAVNLAPENIAAHLNLANAYLLADSNHEVIAHCQQVVTLDHNNAAAYYLLGCANL